MSILKKFISTFIFLLSIGVLFFGILILFNNSFNQNLIHYFSTLERNIPDNTVIMGKPITKIWQNKIFILDIIGKISFLLGFFLLLFFLCFKIKWNKLNKKIDTFYNSTKNYNYFIYSILILIFFVSVVARFPNLNRSISSHHEPTTSAHMLVTQQTWFENGGLKSFFNPIVTYGNQSNKFIKNDMGELKDKKGNSYYVSYPPFSYIFPYLIFRLFNIYPDVLPLEIFNLFFHFISALFIFLIVKEASNNDCEKQLNTPAIIAFTIYLFSPVALWYHSNAYIVDVFLQPIFIICIYFLLKIISDKNAEKKIYYIYFAIANFLMIYTEWMGIFFAFTVCIYTLINFRKKEMQILLYITVLTSILSILLILFQYFQIDGFSSFIKFAANKYMGRSGYVSAASRDNINIYSADSWKSVVFHYILGYLPFLLFILILIFSYFKHSSINILLNNGKNEVWKFLGIISLSPVILHHLVFFNFTSFHDYSVLKTGVFISIFAGWSYFKLIDFFNEESSVNDHRISLSLQDKISKIIFINLLFIFLTAVSILQFKITNPIQNINIYKTIGEKIKNTAKENEVVFLKADNFFIKAAYVFYAHRNIAHWENIFEARKILDLNGCKKGIIFILNSDNTDILNVEFIEN